jgi:hypothetical protein
MERQLSQLCDSIRAATSRYGLIRRQLLNLSMRPGPVQVRKNIDDVVACIDSEIAQIEVALGRYCKNRNEVV